MFAGTFSNAASRLPGGTSAPWVVPVHPRVFLNDMSPGCRAGRGTASGWRISVMDISPHDLFADCEMSWAVCLPKACIHRPFRPPFTSVLFAPQSRRNRLISKVCPSISGHGVRAAGSPPVVPTRSEMPGRFGIVYIMACRDGRISSVSLTSVDLLLAGPAADRNDYFFDQ